MTEPESRKVPNHSAFGPLVRTQTSASSCHQAVANGHDRYQILFLYYSHLTHSLFRSQSEILCYQHTYGDVRWLCIPHGLSQDFHDTKNQPSGVATHAGRGVQQCTAYAKECPRVFYIFCEYTNIDLVLSIDDRILGQRLPLLLPL